MALLFADSFDHYGTSDILKKWSSGALNYVSIDPTGGRRGRGCLKLTNAVSGSDNGVRRSFPSQLSTVIAGAAYQSNLSVQGNFIYFYAGTAFQLVVVVSSAGAIAVYRGWPSGTVLGTSASGVITSLAWAYIEVKATFHTTAGAVEVRVNGSTVLSLSGVNTAAAGVNYADNYVLGVYQNGGPLCYWDDHYLCDTSGTVNNNFLGDIRVDCLVPTSDGAYNSFNSSVVGRSARYWRLYMTAAQVSNYVNLSELEFRASAGGADQCAGGTAMVDTTLSGSASAVFDNSTATSWESNGTWPHWAAYDFGPGVTKEIVEVSIRNTATINESPTVMQMQYSDDGVTWYTAFDFSTPANWQAYETRVFTRPTNAKYWQVDELGGINNDTVYSNTPGNRQTFGFQDLASTTGTVYGVQSVATVVKDDAGVRAAKLLAKSGSTLSSSAANYLGTSVFIVSQILEADPATGAAWTPNAINNAEFGVEVV